MALQPGRSVLIKIDTAEVGGSSATWLTIGQQRGGSLKRSSDTVDGTNKGDNGWPNSVVTRTPWSVSVDGALDPADGAWVHVLARWEGKIKVWVQIDASAISGGKKEGQCVITNLQADFPEKDLVSFTIDFEGASALVTSP
jgi:predicted secreted protein